jgi:nitrogen fixation NifU-like protein
MPNKLDAAIIFPPAGNLVEPVLAQLVKGGTLVMAPVSASPIVIENYSQNLWGHSIQTLFHLRRSDAEEFFKLVKGLELKVGVIEHAHNPRNLERIDRPDAHKILRGPCGDTMEIYLRLDKERISDVTFMTDGCGPSIACGSMLTTLVRGITLEEAGTIEPEDLLAALDGLPEESAHCARLAVDKLRKAIGDWHRVDEKS